MVFTSPDFDNFSGNLLPLADFGSASLHPVLFDSDSGVNNGLSLHLAADFAGRLLKALAPKSVLLK